MSFVAQSLLSLYLPTWQNNQRHLRQSWIDWQPASEPQSAAPEFREQTSRIVNRLKELRRALTAGPLASSQRWPPPGAIAAVAPPEDRLLAASSEISERLRGLRHGLAMERPPRHFRWIADADEVPTTAALRSHRQVQMMLRWL